MTWEDVPGFTDDDLAALYGEAIAGARADDVLVEVGAYLGRGACLLGTLARETGRDLAIFTVDRCHGHGGDDLARTESLGGSWAGATHAHIRRCGLEGLVCLIAGPSPRAARAFADGSVAWCCLDADHDYASVLADLRAWAPKVRRGGVLCGHDYRRPDPGREGVTRAVREFFGADCPHPDRPHLWHRRME